MTLLEIIVLTVVVLAAVVGLGLLIFRLQRRAQDVVPRAADEAGGPDRVVAVDDAGRPVTESEDLPAGPAGDAAGFERALAEEFRARHPEGTGADEGPDGGTDAS
jgi:hypothetical protein